MKLKKEDIVISYESLCRYQILIRKRVFYFFNIWVPLTYQETEFSDEKILEFDKFSDAENFVNEITD